MDYLFDLQQKFEELISELEKLRSANEIVEINLDSSTTIAKAVEEFVSDFRVFYEKIKKDYVGLPKDLETSIIKLNNLISELETINSENSAQVIENINSNLSNIFEDIKEYAKKIIDYNFEKTVKLKSELSEFFNKSLDNVIEAFQKELNENNKKLDENKEKLDEHIKVTKYYGKKTRLQIDEQKGFLDKLHSTVNEKIDSLETLITTNAEKEFKHSETLCSELKKELEDKHKEILELHEKSSEEIKSLKKEIENIDKKVLYFGTALGALLVIDILIKLLHI